jgi:hypothetical protein
MPRTKKDNETVMENEEATTKSPYNTDWTDHVLSMLTDDELIAGNPTTDGLRRIFETVLNCEVIESIASVVQAPSPENEKRATVVYTLTYVSKDENAREDCRTKTVSGAADVYWGNCDKIYRNHPVAVAETRAEGRALRRALRLRKVVAAEEIAKDIEDHPDGNSVSKISNNQINFIDVIAKRLDISPIKILTELAIDTSNVYNISHEDGVKTIHTLSGYQTNIESIPEHVKGYDHNWK